MPKPVEMEKLVVQKVWVSPVPLTMREQFKAEKTFVIFKGLVLGAAVVLILISGLSVIRMPGKAEFMGVPTNLTTIVVMLGAIWLLTTEMLSLVREKYPTPEEIEEHNRIVVAKVAPQHDY
jgi:uncharacterized membrane protein YcjF (UPF0283 family)